MKKCNLVLRYSFAVALCVFASNLLSAQETKNPNPDAVKIARNYVNSQQKTWQLTTSDIDNAKLDYAYHTEHNGVTHIYFIQSHAGIALENALINVNVMPDGSILYAGNRFVSNLASKVSASRPSISAQQALENALLHLQKNVSNKLIVKEQKATNDFIFNDEILSAANILVRLRYDLINEQARLVWQVEVEPRGDADRWYIAVDAVSGAIATKRSMTIHCKVENNMFATAQTDECDPTQKTSATTPLSTVLEKAQKSSMLIGGGTYNVLALPAESPVHGNFRILTDPADSLASPYGWHDTNGAAGAEYTITRGNNVNAYLDWQNTSTPSEPQPDGGANLAFNYPYSPSLEPDSMRKLAQVNLFYMNNAIHDITYHYGFNEAAGNFQQNNYGRGGAGNDFVVAEAQDGSGLATPNTNNANFSTPRDGQSGRMQMYVWTSTAQANMPLKVTAPTSIVGDYEALIAGFGAPLPTTPIVGQVELVNDGSVTPSYSCFALRNTTLTNKVALIDRGSCTFVEKVRFAQQKGAKACLVCNFENTLITMGGTAADITIPAVMIKKIDCDRIKAQLAAGVTVSLGAGAVVPGGPTRLDGDFDNGIIAHEYTHGISNRLTGGPNNTSCLNNSEQMGEGWSDFIALALTAKPSDRNNLSRGVGTFVMRQATNGRGIRRYPYTTDLNNNPLTYNDIISNPQVHDLGEVWSVTLWDLYWAFVDLYGWSDNFRNMNSGNAKALQLVMDGMKMQPCLPGFVDGRNAILAADRANFGGQHQCLIWDVFARRGLGYKAKQGLSTSTGDNEESFDKNPYCIKTIKIEKEVPETANPAETVTVTLRVMNHKETSATNVVVTDEIPTGASFVAGSASNGGILNGNLVTFNIASMRSLDTLVLTYRLNVGSRRSTAFFYDGMENGDNNWDLDAGASTTTIWEISTAGGAYRGRAMWEAGSGNTKSDARFFNVANINVTGAKPVLRFFQNYNTEAGFDGGLLEISTNNGSTWQDLGNKIFRNGYNSKLNYQTLVLPNLTCFSGSTNGYKASYVDLGSFSGQNIKVRWRFAADSTQPAGFGASFWQVDEILLMDMVNHDGRARVSSAQGDTASAVANGRGIVVEPSTNVSNEDLGTMGVRIYPNPTHDFININIEGAQTENAQVTVTDAAGRQIEQLKIGLSNGRALVPLSTSTWASGVYFLQVKTAQEVKVQKVIKQ